MSIVRIILTQTQNISNVSTYTEHTHPPPHHQLYKKKEKKHQLVILKTVNRIKYLVHLFYANYIPQGNQMVDEKFVFKMAQLINAERMVKVSFSSTVTPNEWAMEDTKVPRENCVCPTGHTQDNLHLVLASP